MAIVKLKLTFFSPIRVCVTLHIFSISSLKLYTPSTISILLASILLISNIFPTISSNVCDALIISFESSTTSGGTWSLYVPISSDKPTIAFKGVLISWLILDKKSDLAWFARSAWSLASVTSFNIFKSGFSIVKNIMITINENTYPIKNKDG